MSRAATRMRREKIRPGDTFGAYGSKHKGVITEVKDDCIKFEITLKCGIIISGSMTESLFRKAYTTRKPIKKKSYEWKAQEL